MGAKPSATVQIFLTPEGPCLKPTIPEEKAMEKVAVFSLTDLKIRFPDNHITTVCSSCTSSCQNSDTS